MGSTPLLRWHRSAAQVDYARGLGELQARRRPSSRAANRLGRRRRCPCCRAGRADRADPERVERPWSRFGRSTSSARSGRARRAPVRRPCRIPQARRSSLLDQGRVVRGRSDGSPPPAAARGLLQASTVRGSSCGCRGSKLQFLDRLDVAPARVGLNAGEVSEEMDGVRSAREGRLRTPLAAAASAGTPSRHWPSAIRFSTRPTPH